MTTSYELSLKLKELGVEQIGGEYYWMKSNGFFLDENENVVPVEDAIRVMYHKDLVREDTILCRAFTLGELVRMLPQYFSISAIPNDFYITSYNAHVHNTSPEEAAAELAIELVVSGVIKFN